MRNLLFCFISSHYSGHSSELSRELRRLFPSARLFGSSGSGIVGAGREEEDQPSLSLLGGETPDVRTEAFWLGDGTDGEWLDGLEVQPEHQPLFFLLGDPFHKKLQQCISDLDEAYPAAPKIGGLSSGMAGPMQSSLFLDGSVHKQGTIGLAVYGDIAMTPIVAQGCIPLGKAMQVTRARDNLVLELDGLPATKALQQLAETLPARVFESFQRMPMVGIHPPSVSARPGPGDFLVRNVLGISRGEPGLLIGAHVSKGQIIQFHLRNRESAVTELESALELARARNTASAACLLFSCIGRGRRLYDRPGFESSLFLSQFPGTPMAGFFCNGEIGPVRGNTFVHGYTSAYGIIGPRDWS